MSEQVSRAVAAEIARLLEERQLSGNDLAKATGISQTGIAAKLRGATPFGLADLEKICKELGLTIAQLMERAGV